MKRWQRLTALAVAQIAVIAGLAGWQERILGQGEKITLKVLPIDPRSLFQGDYVILRYGISEVNLPGFYSPPEPGQKFYVALAQVEGEWRVEEIEEEFFRIPGGVTLAGRVVDPLCPERGPCRVEILYGLEQFFLPEGTGRAVEELRNAEELSAEISVDGRTGEARLVALWHDGRVLQPGAAQQD